MDRRRMTAIGVVLAAAGLTAAVTLPSFAGDQGTPNAGGADARATGGVAPEVVDALSRDLRISRDQAVRRLTAEQQATGRLARLRAALGNDYGGAWLSGDGSTLNVAVADPAQADRVRAAGAVPKQVDRAVTELDAAKSRLDSVGRRLPRRSPAGTSTSPPTPWWCSPSRVPSRGPRRWAGSGRPAGAVRITPPPGEQPRPLFDLVGGDAVLHQGGRALLDRLLGARARLRQRRALRPGGRHHDRLQPGRAGHLPGLSFPATTTPGRGQRQLDPAAVVNGSGGGNVPSAAPPRPPSAPRSAGPAPPPAGTAAPSSSATPA